MSPSGGNTIPSGVEFPSQRRERIDWHKLASIDLHDLTSGCSIEVLQDNLTQVAFCDAEAEFDLGTVAGQRNLLKVFRLAQLTVQYLFLSQDFMETQLKEAQEEVEQVTEKYQQVETLLYLLPFLIFSFSLIFRSVLIFYFLSPLVSSPLCSLTNSSRGLNTTSYVYYVYLVIFFHFHTVLQLAFTVPHR